MTFADFRRVGLLALCCLLLGGCAVDAALRDSSRLSGRGDLDGALTRIDQTLHGAPDDLQLRAERQRLLALYAARTLDTARRALDAGDYAAASRAYQALAARDPGNERASQGLRQLEMRAQHQRWLAQAEQLAGQDPGAALDWLSKILAEEPDWQAALTLRDRLLRQSNGDEPGPDMPAALKRPVSLSFRNQSLSSIFDAVSGMTGLNFIFDREVPASMPATIVARHSTAWQAINVLLATHHLAKKLLNGNTLLIYPARPDKAAEYQDLAVRTYYLSNADPKAVLDTLKQVLKPRDIAIDTRLNAVVLRDTPAVLAAADRLVQALDLPQSEVTLDVEVLEVSDKLSRALGIDYPGQIGIGFPSQVTGQPLALTGITMVDQLRHLTGSKLGVNFGDSLGRLDLNQSNEAVRTLANPKIRVKNHEKATIKIGEKLPVVTTTTSSSGFAGSSVSYQDVGLSLNVEPSISLGSEVSVKVSLEVSDVLGNPTKLNDGTLVYTLGSRSASTVLSTRDNVTQVLGGLIKRNDSHSSGGLPYLSSVPLLDSLFGSRGSTRENTEIVLLITPHIVRAFTPPPAAVTRFDVGPENRVGDPLRLEDGNGPMATAAVGGAVPPPPAPASLPGTALPAPGAGR